ncbi:hypothetical protein [Micromonospora coxensis]|uniref:Uncharacterized protein n=1 Tax=Micromonospora coxensis TaxID=356852 RepID=A0A1C5IRC9_9ACTN|nr:hypothetical protein [Micromonospora coxensis]SCG60908.1 hypothetical protein GA0070614_3275 [Micromonospora coxensis]
MARRGWGASVATAVGVAAGVGAAQLGFAYGLGIIDWAPAEAGRTEAAWFASLAWATWIAAVSGVLGAVVAQRLDDRGADADAPPGGTLRRVALAVGGALGSALTVLLVAVPARAATVPDIFAPQTVAAGYAAAGVLLGLLAALWALASRAAASNVIATVGWLWLLAVVSVVDGVLAGRGLATAQLGIWQISGDRPGFWLRDYVYWPGVLLTAGSALVIGALAARRTARVAERRLGAAVSGAAGPLLVAVAYLLAVPRLASITPAQVSAQLFAPYAVVIGAAGSVLVAALAQRADRRAAAGPQVTVPRQRTGEPTIVDEPAPADPALALTGARRAGRTPKTATTTAGPAADPMLAEAGTESGRATRPADATTTGPATGARSRGVSARRGRTASPDSTGTDATSAGSTVAGATGATATGAGSTGVDSTPVESSTGDLSVAEPSTGGTSTGGHSDDAGPATGPKPRPGRRTR